NLAGKSYLYRLQKAVRPPGSSPVYTKTKHCTKLYKQVMKLWSHCNNLLIIRPDNMGDLLMSSPAIRALKETFSCRITLLTSTAAAGAAALLPEIDDLLVYNLPWVKQPGRTNPALIRKLIAD